MKIIVASATSWLSIFALYLFFTGKLTWPEIMAAAISAAISLTAILAVQWQRSHRFAFRWSWLSHFRFVPFRILSDCGIVLAAICRRPFQYRSSGRFAIRQFRHGEERPVVRTRRALVTLAISITPNTFVTKAPAEADELSVHELVPGDHTGKDKYWPV